MSNIESIKARITKLANVTLENGASENEVNKAMGLIATYLEEYNLSLTESMVKEDPMAHRKFYTGFKNMLAYSTCILKIAALTDTLAWHNKDNRGILQYNYFGMESDADASVHFTTIIHRSMIFFADQYKLTAPYIMARSRREASTAFQYGFVSRINQRLDEMVAHKEEAETKQIEAEVESNSSTSTALVLVMKEERVQSEMKKKLGFLPGVGKTKKGRKFLADAFRAGQASGNSVKLSVESMGRKAIA